MKAPGDFCDLDHIELDHTFETASLPPYSRLLFDVLEGGLMFSIRDDEAEEFWRIVEPILVVWADEDVPLCQYPAGSDGPARLTTRMRAREESYDDLERVASP